MAVKNKKIKAFSDENAVISNSISKIISYGKEKDPTIAPRTENQMVEIILTGYVNFLEEHNPEQFDARNLFTINGQIQ
jgi:hypothetical protein